MRVLVLSKYGRRAASPRHRFLAYGPFLAERGIEIEFSPLLDDDYLNEKLDRGATNLRLVALAYLRRIATLASARKYDLLLIHYELFPYFPAWFEQLLFRLNIPYVVDYDDAIFHMYDSHFSGVVRGLLGGKIRRVIAGARAVMAGSEYLANYARRYNECVHVVPTVVDLDRYRVKDWAERSDQPFTIGWIGSPSTASYLELVKEPLAALGKETEARLSIMGATRFSVDNIEVSTLPWSESTEAEFIVQCDVGIMPLPDEKWARGKCAFKLIQYMACGLPVIASPVGANVDVVSSEVGLLAADADQWLDALRSLNTNPDLRRRMGRSGRQQCQRSYSLVSQAARVTEILQTAAISAR